MTSSNARSQNAIDWLVKESHRHGNSEDFVASLAAQIKDSSPPSHSLKYAIGALRTACEVHLKNQADESTRNTCDFCGKSSDDVRTMIVSNNSALCDECAVAALHTISYTKGQWYLRLAFFVFRVIASIGRIFHRGSV